MKKSSLSDISAAPAASPEGGVTTGTQTLLRGLAILDCVADGVSDVANISLRLGTARSTTHRLLSSLVQQKYLHHIAYKGYMLGPKLLYLGARAQEQRPLVALARPHLEALAQQTGDTVHLGICEGEQVLYLDKITATKGLEMRSRVGQRMPMATTGIGKALMLGMGAARWETLFQRAQGLRDAPGDRPAMHSWEDYLQAMQQYQSQGWVRDLEENELGIHCVGAPVRDLSGEVVAAISVASAVPYMPDERMDRLGPVVLRRALLLSQELGWKAPAP
ncbi:MAG: IclR family transcriptional regulator [Polaromonas sp.]|jgi:DNA-binding IclR family transcriptional regulator|nr:IclR family transcriptional regulator [Polaromonas sp.]